MPFVATKVFTEGGTSYEVGDVIPGVRYLAPYVSRGLVTYAPIANTFPKHIVKANKVIAEGDDQWSSPGAIGFVLFAEFDNSGSLTFNAAHKYPYDEDGTSSTLYTEPFARPQPETISDEDYATTFLADLDSYSGANSTGKYDRLGLDLTNQATIEVEAGRLYMFFIEDYSSPSYGDFNPDQEYDIAPLLVSFGRSGLGGTYRVGTATAAPKPFPEVDEIVTEKIKAANRVPDVGSTRGALAFTAGTANAATGTYALALVANNTASGVASVAIGVMNQATAAYSTAIGFSSEAHGNSAVALGSGTVAEGSYSFTAGRYSKTTNPGQIATAADKRTVVGDAQYSRITQSNLNTSQINFGQYSSDGALIPDGQAATFEANVIMRSADTTAATVKCWTIKGVIANNGTALRVVGTPTKTVVAADAGASSWDVTFSVSGKNVVLSLTSSTNYTVATLELTQCG